MIKPSVRAAGSAVALAGTAGAADPGGADVDSFVGTAGAATVSAGWAAPDAAFVSDLAGASPFGCCALRLAAPTASAASTSTLCIVFIFMDSFRVRVVV